MVKKFITAWDKHCILYPALLGVVANMFFGPKIDVIGAAAVFGFLGALIWYPLKALFITGNTAANWKTTHPGEPMFQAGGLTEYDTAFAKSVGETVAKGVHHTTSPDNFRVE